jgi:hypothetical protein
MRSDPTLKRWYRVINKRFFDKQLTNNVCVRWANEAEIEKYEERFFGYMNTCDDGYHEWVIVLSESKCSAPSITLLTLAHEMCHIATKMKDDHGPAFEYWRQYIGDRGIFKKGALRKGLTIF